MDNFDYMRKMLRAWHPHWNQETLDNFTPDQLTAIYLRDEPKYNKPRRSTVGRDYMIEKLLDWRPDWELSQLMSLTTLELEDAYTVEQGYMVEETLRHYIS